jgi:hypothetical protein
MQQSEHEDRAAILELFNQCISKLAQNLQEVARLKQLEAHKSLDPCQVFKITAAAKVMHLLNSELDDYRRVLHMMVDENFKTFLCADGQFIERVTGVNIMYKKWDPFQGIGMSPPLSSEGIGMCPSPKFKEIFEENMSVVSMCTKAGRRTYLDLFLRDILARKEFSSYFRVFSNLHMSAQTGSEQLWGSADLVIGPSQCDEFSSLSSKNLHIIATDASIAWCRESYWQCVAAAATLHKLLEGGKANRNVWGILSNGENWHFIFIDNNSHLWTSQVFRLDIYEYSESDVGSIYQMIYYIVARCFFERLDVKS